MKNPIFPTHLSCCAAALIVSLSVAGCGDDDGSGNNNIQPDGSSFDGSTQTDSTVDQDGGPGCGNNIKEGSEQCDGNDLGGQTCTGLGHLGGTLACAGNCTFDESNCTHALPDPAAFRAADQAEVCSTTPPQDCTPADMGFVLSEYGSTVDRGDDAGGTSAVYRLVAFVERLGPSNIDVLVVDHNANPVANIPVAFYWPDAPNDSRPDEWYPKKVETLTGANGVAGFALGGGAYLPCCGCGGPHAIWVSEPDTTPNTTVPTDLADHLGMLGGTNHRHLDLIFQKVDPPPAQQPADAVRCPVQ